jgi:hypothetical protein
MVIVNIIFVDGWSAARTVERHRKMIFVHIFSPWWRKPSTNVTVNPAKEAKYITNHLAAISAGGVATSAIHPENHTALDSQFDENEARNVLERFVSDKSKGEAIMKAANTRARDLVMQNRGAILAVRDALISNHGFLNGDDAAVLISSILT